MRYHINIMHFIFCFSADLVRWICGSNPRVGMIVSRGSKTPDSRHTGPSESHVSVRVGSAQELFKTRGSGQEIFRISRVGSGDFPNLAGRVGSQQDISNSSRVGLDWLS